MRASIAIAVLSLPTVIVAAPAPVYRSPITPELAAIFQAADGHVRTAVRIQHRLGLEGHSLTPEEKTRLRDDRSRALRGAAERYTRLLQLVDSLERPHPEVKDLSARAGMGAVKALFDLQDYAGTVRLHARLSHFPTDPKARLSMMVTILCCRKSLLQFDELRKELRLIRKEVAKLDATERGTWEQWLAMAAQEIGE
jgi:hypothetical protein